MRRPTRHRALTDYDRAAWADYVRHVAPLAGRASPEVPAVPLAVPAAIPSALRVAAPPAATALAAPLVVGMQPPGVDNATWQRFRTGRLAPARTLDLHGRTAQRAFHALEHFVRQAHGDRLRCVEVITGRGTGEAGGVLRREVPLWLNLPGLRPLLLAATHPHPANVGALRLLLRRAR